MAWLKIKHKGFHSLDAPSAAVLSLFTVPHDFLSAVCGSHKKYFMIATIVLKTATPAQLNQDKSTMMHWDRGADSARIHLSPLFFWVCLRCFGEDYCLSVPDVKAVVMVLQPSEPRITITGSNRLVRPAGDLQGPLGVAPFKELHITSTVMKGDSSGGRECRGCLCALLQFV